VTTSDQPVRRNRPALRGGLLLGTLLLASAPVFAAPMLATDAADPWRVASTGQALVDDTAPGRTSLSAADVNRLIEAQAALQARPQGRVQTLLQRATALLGTPYRWGGNTPDAGFDCSGLVAYVFRSALGIELPRVSRDMASSGTLVERGALAAGDLVFFGRRGSRIDHVGIYVGEGRFVHAPRTGKDVMVSDLDTGYWAGRFVQARRVEALGG
jgi:cell wall-associated NlpC family hydrolase